MWLVPESNQEHADFQSTALPTELLGDKVIQKILQKLINSSYDPFPTFISRSI